MVSEAVGKTEGAVTNCGTHISPSFHLPGVCPPPTENKTQLHFSPPCFPSVLIVIFIHRRFEDIPDIGSESQGVSLQLCRGTAFWL